MSDTGFECNLDGLSGRESSTVDCSTGLIVLLFLKIVILKKEAHILGFFTPFLQ
jgi:hypothetical protein